MMDGRYMYGKRSRNVTNINPYRANVENMVGSYQCQQMAEYGGLLPMLANGGWDLIRRLKG